MHFHGPIVRPPIDADSVFIEVTVGCTYDDCTFCNFYDGYPFSVAPLSQIKADLIEVSRVQPNAAKVWASGGNPYALAPDRLVEIGRLIRKYLPNARISCYARVDDVTRKSVEELRAIKEAGFEDVVLGMESADDEVLTAMRKGYTAADVLECGRRLEAAGVDYRVIYLGGLAGAGKAVESADRTAALLNQLHPYCLLLTTVAIMPGTELYNQMLVGDFVEVAERERMQEYRTLIAGLTNPIHLFSVTSTSSLRFNVPLPEYREKVLSTIDRALEGMTDAREASIMEHHSRLRTI